MIRAGCGACPVARSTYYEQLDTVEVVKLPRVETAARWLAQAPRDFVFSVVADPVVAAVGFRPGRERDEAWERTTLVARALKAKFIVLETPPSFYPQADRLRDFYGFAKACDRAGAVLAWQPARGWEAGVVRRVCGDLRLLHAVDPLIGAPAAGAVRYFRLRGGGPGRKPSRGHRYSEAELRTIAEAGQGAPAYAYFLTADAWIEARRLKEMTSPLPRPAGRRPGAL